MKPFDLGVRPEPDERRQDDPDAGHDERDPRPAAGALRAAAVRRPEDPRADALGGVGPERVQEGPQGRRVGAPGAAGRPDRADLDVRMTVAQHLDELRSRLLRSIVALSLAVTVAMIFYKGLIGIALLPQERAMSWMGKPASFAIVDIMASVGAIMRLA